MLALVQCWRRVVHADISCQSFSDLYDFALSAVIHVRYVPVYTVHVPLYMPSWYHHQVVHRQLVIAKYKQFTVKCDHFLYLK